MLHVFASKVPRSPPPSSPTTAAISATSCKNSRRLELMLRTPCAVAYRWRKHVISEQIGLACHNCSSNDAATVLCRDYELTTTFGSQIARGHSRSRAVHQLVALVLCHDETSWDWRRQQYVRQQWMTRGTLILCTDSSAINDATCERRITGVACSLMMRPCNPPQ